MEKVLYKSEYLLKECIFTFLKSSGKGGQNVNKVSTKVELYFDISSSLILSQEQKDLIISRMPKNLSHIRMLSSKERSQAQNLKAVSERFIKRIDKLLEPMIERIPTSPTRASKEKRIRDKMALAEKKSLRKTLNDDD